MAAIEIEVTPEQRQRNADAALKAVEKEFGKGSIINMGERVGISIPSIPTGIYEVDYSVIGCGGVPRGRIVEIYGPESGGKTTLALQIIAQVHKLGGRAAFIDAEHALDPNYATALGVDMNSMIVSQPDYGEQALRIVEMLAESGAFDVIVVDSVAALVPKSELDGEIGDSNVGTHARLMSQAMRKLTGVVAKSNTCLVFINQIREKIGVMFGSPETTTGGRALKFFASLRLDVRRIAQYKEGDQVVGNKVKIKGAKNKVGSPFREAEINLIFGRGFDANGSVFDAAVEAKIVEKSGSWFSYKGERLDQGREKSIAAAVDRNLLPEFLAELRKDSV